MKCPFCGFDYSRVIDSRPSDENNSIRRRRQCDGCGRRFTTYETVETSPILVIKNDGTRQPFDSAKIRNGIIRSCETRPVPMHVIDKLVSDIEKKVYNTLEQEIHTSKIGEYVMDGLKEIDQVAYIRFASVYRQFRDVTTFVEFISDIDKKDN